MTLSIAGIIDSYKSPKFLAQLVLGAGALSTGVGDLRCLLVGMPAATGGTIVPDAAPIGPFTDIESVLAATGNNCQLAVMANAAFLAAPTCSVWLGAVSEPGSGTKATVTSVLGGSWTTGGEITYRINGKSYALAIAPSDTVDTVGAALAAKINADPLCPFMASYNSSTNTLTLSCGNKGASGKDWVVYVVTDSVPSGMTATLVGSANVTGGGVRAGASSTGTGTEDVTALLAALQGQTWNRPGVGHNDSTNVALWKAYVEAKTGATVQRYELPVFGANGSKSAVTSLAQTTLNHKYAAVCAARSLESHPACISAAAAAVRSVREGGSAESGNWVPDYDGYPLVGLAPYAKEAAAEQWDDDEVEQLLNAGVTPLITVNGQTVIVRAITSYSLLGGTTADDRCLDWGDVVFPTNAIVDLKNLYETQFRAANKYVGPDPAEGEEPAPPGVGTPEMWSSTVQSRNKDYFRIGYIEDPDANPPQSEYSRSAKRIMSKVTWVVRRVMHNIGVIGVQRAS